MQRNINGVYIYSDSYLKKKTKSELIEYIRTIEKNWIKAEETNNIQFENCKKLLLEERNGVIKDFADRLSEYLDVKNATKYGNKNAEQQANSYDTLMKYEIADAIDDISEQMKADVK